MFNVFGHEEIVRNIYRVSHPFIGGRTIETTDDLRPSYLDFLADHQPYMPVNRGDDVFVDDVDIEDELVAAYGHNATLNDLHQAEVIGEAYDAEMKRAKLQLAREALDTFRDLDDTLAAVFDLVVHSIVVRPSTRPQGRASHGGSSSAAIGTIWLAVGPAITHDDIVEMLTHELTHHLLFIDERNYPHFDYGLIAREENRAYSAILNMIRPVDKVVHSIAVATELVLARRRWLRGNRHVSVHPATEKMIANALAAYDSITGLQTADLVLRPRTREILARCRAACISERAALEAQDVDVLS